MRSNPNDQQGNFLNMKLCGREITRVLSPQRAGQWFLCRKDNDDVSDLLQLSFALPKELTHTHWERETLLLHCFIYSRAHTSALTLSHTYTQLHTCTIHLDPRTGLISLSLSLSLLVTQCTSQFSLGLFPPYSLHKALWLFAQPLKAISVARTFTNSSLASFCLRSLTLSFH